MIDGPRNHLKDSQDLKSAEQSGFQQVQSMQKGLIELSAKCKSKKSDCEFKNWKWFL